MLPMLSTSSIVLMSFGRWYISSGMELGAYRVHVLMLVESMDDDWL